MHGVYPRVGGGNCGDCYEGRGHTGLSPRGRGKRAVAQRQRHRKRSIPAWVGETIEILNDRNDRLGLSPRGRGKLKTQGGQATAIRSIPAWAGETSVSKPWKTKPWVYPRVGGGNLPDPPFHSPQGGLSPRGRGKRLPSCTASVCGRSIPAWAGETRSRCAGLRMSTVYPRVGGGNQSSAASPRWCLGLSPRGRGKLDW